MSDIFIFISFLYDFLFLFFSLFSDFFATFLKSRKPIIKRGELRYLKIGIYINKDS